MSPVKEKGGGGHTEPFEQELDFKHAVGHYEKLFKSKFLRCVKLLNQSQNASLIQTCKNLCCVLAVFSISVWVWWIKWGTLFLCSLLLSLARSPCPLLCGKDTFTSHVLQVLLRDVKFGETVSYKRLAEMAGNPRAVRAVGGAMMRNPVSVADIDWQASLLLTLFCQIGKVIVFISL